MIFYLSYKLSNYWNLNKIKRFLKPERFRIAILNVVLYVILYALLITFFGRFILVNLLPAFLLSLVWKELVILTQHSHIEIPVSEGKTVRPVSTLKQIEYSRSFYIHPILSHYFLFGFNLHFCFKLFRFGFPALIHAVYHKLPIVIIHHSTLNFLSYTSRGLGRCKINS